MRRIGPLDGLLGFLSVFDWITPAIQIITTVPRDVNRMAQGKPVDPFVRIHGADFPQAMVVLEYYNVPCGIFDTIIPPFYPFVAWKGVRVPSEKITEILLALDLAGVRYQM